MSLPLPSCRIDGCRFSRGYDARTIFAAPQGGTGLPPVLVFATDARTGFPHFREHFPWLTGSAVVEQLRMAWRPARLTVAEVDAGALVWVVDHDALDETFDDERVKLVTKPCSGYRAGEHCCKGCVEKRPDRMTLRSVQAWQQFGFKRVLYTDVDDMDSTEYLTDQPDAWIGRQFDISPETRLETPWKRAEFHYRVRIDVDGKIVTARVAAGRDQSEMIDADEAEFVRTHVVIFTSRGKKHLLMAYFRRRR